MHEQSDAILTQIVALSGGSAEVDHVWLIDEHEPGNMLPPPPLNMDEANRIYYVDLYSRGQLMLYIPCSREYTLRAPHKFLALDSNMFNSFKRFVLDSERGTVLVAGMERLIDYAVENQFSVLPTPYLLEMIAAHGFDAARPYCVEIVESTLRLIYMDGEVFRASRQMSFTEVALQRLDSRFGTRDFRQAAERRTEQLLGGYVPIRAHYYTTYLAVLALVAIGLQYPDRDGRVAAFDELFAQRIGGSLPRYMLLARLYYFGKISGWIGSAPGSDNYGPDRVRAAGYDFALTMLNEEVMQMSDPADPEVVVLVTHDRQLAINAPLMMLKGMSLLKNGEIRVLNPWNEALIDEIFGGHANQLRRDMDAKLAIGAVVNASPDEVIEIIHQYEDILNVPRSALSSLRF